MWTNLPFKIRNGAKRANYFIKFKHFSSDLKNLGTCTLVNKKDHDTEIPENKNKIPNKSSFLRRSELATEVDKFSIPDENQFIKKGYVENKISNEIQMTCIPERIYLIKWTTMINIL